MKCGKANFVCIYLTENAMNIEETSVFSFSVVNSFVRVKITEFCVNIQCIEVPVAYIGLHSSDSIYLLVRMQKNVCKRTPVTLSYV